MTLRDEKLKVLQGAEADHGRCRRHSSPCAGNIAPAPSDGGAVKGYLEELGSTTSKTETFVAIKAEIENWRWAGVPFYLRTGKRLPSRVSEIVVTFKPVPHSIFGTAAGPVVLEPPGASACSPTRA